MEIYGKYVIKYLSLGNFNDFSFLAVLHDQLKKVQRQNPYPYIVKSSGES